MNKQNYLENNNSSNYEKEVYYQTVQGTASFIYSSLVGGWFTKLNILDNKIRLLLILRDKCTKMTAKALTRRAGSRVLVNCDREKQ